VICIHDSVYVNRVFFSIRSTAVDDVLVILRLMSKLFASCEYFIDISFEICWRNATACAE